MSSRTSTQSSETAGDRERPEPPRSQPWFGLRDVASVLPVVLVFLFEMQIATRWNAGHREMALAGLMVFVTQIVPGIVIWRAVRARDGWWIEDLALGFGVGAGLAVPSQVLGVWTGAHWLAAVLPLAVAALLMALPSPRARVLSARCNPLPWAWGVAVAATCALPVYNAFVAFREPLRWRGWATPYIDMPYHLALSGELSHHFPPHYPQVAGDRLYYHWFAHAWMAQVGNTSGTDLDVILTRFMPALIAVAVPVIVACVAMRISGLVWAGPLAAAVAFAVGPFDVWGFGSLALPIAGATSPTQGFGVLALLCTLALMAMRWRGDVGGWTYAVLAPMMLIAGGSKGSTLPILAAGGVTAVVMAFALRSKHRGRVLLDSATAVVLVGVLVKVLFGGEAGGTRPHFLSTSFTAQAGTVMADGGDLARVDLGVYGLLFSMTICLGAVGGLWVLFGRDTRRDPVGWLLAGCTAAGVGAILVLDHPGAGQYYFLRTAEAPLSLLGGWGLALVLARCRRQALVAAVGAVAGIVGVYLLRRWPGPLTEAGAVEATAWGALVLFLLLAVVVGLVTAFGAAGRGSRRAVVVGVVVTAFSAAGLVPVADALRLPLPQPESHRGHTPGAFHSRQVTAARWIRDHSSADDVVMTNLHCRGAQTPGCDHRWFYVAAYSERRVLVEGWAYTRNANRLGSAGSGVSAERVPFWHPELLRLNDDFLTHPTSDAAQRLWDLGVRWAYVYDRAPHVTDLAPYAQKRFEVPGVQVYRVQNPSRTG